MRKLHFIIAALLLVSAAGFVWTEVRQRSTADQTLPVIECPDTPLVIQVGESSQEVLLEGVTAWDEKDGDLTAQVMVEGIEKSVQDNETTVIYAVVDSDSHVTKLTRTVRYTDYTPPRFGLSMELRYELGEPVVIRNRVTAWDVIDGDLSSQVKVTSTGLDALAEGHYPVTFEVTNSMGDTSIWTAEIRIQNRAAGEPYLLLKQYLVYLKAGDSFQPMDYFGEVIGGDAANVTVESNVDTGTPGSYQVTYSCVGTTGVTGTTQLFVVVE